MKSSPPIGRYAAAIEAISDFVLGEVRNLAKGVSWIINENEDVELSGPNIVTIHFGSGCEVLD